MQHKLAIAAVLLCMLAVSSFSLRTENQDTVPEQYERELIDSNADALSGIRYIDDQLLIVDTIPCWSFAQVRNTIFTRVIGAYYVDCSTCDKAHGRPYGEPSKCTSVRKINVEKNLSE